MNTSDEKSLSNNKIKSKQNRIGGLTNGNAMHKNQNNGLTNGLASQSGLTNEMGGGLTNGLGGGSGDSGYDRGYTNGLASGYKSGFTNGMGNDSAQVTLVPLKRNTKHSKHQQALIALCLVVAIISAPFISSFLVNDVPIIIDGVFKDWLKVRTYTDSIGDVSVGSIDITTYKGYVYKSNLYLYISSATDLLVGNNSVHDTIVILADTDANQNTGYQVNGLGYDYMVSVSGCDKQIVNKKAFVYMETGDDWNSWMPRGLDGVGLKDNEIEFEIPEVRSSNIVADAYIISANGDVDQIDCLVGDNYRAFRVEQEVIAPEVTTVGNNKMLNLTISCDANQTKISSITFNKQGTAKDNSFGKFSLLNENGVAIGEGFINRGQVKIDCDIIIDALQQRNYTLSVNMLEVESGDTFMFSINSPYDILADMTPKVYQPIKIFTYIGYKPTDVRIDGGFAEWDFIEHYQPTLKDKTRLTIIGSDAELIGGCYSMAIKYKDRALSGDLFPIHIGNGLKVPTNNANTTNTISEVTQNNSTPQNQTQTNIVDKDPTTGEDVLIVNFGDYKKVEIKGKNGVITQSVYSELIGEEWETIGSVISYCDEYHVEFSIPDVFMEGNQRVIITTSDWKGNNEDYTHSLKSTGLELFGSKSEPQPIPLGTISLMDAHGYNETRTLTMDGVVDDDAWAGAYTSAYVVDQTQDMKLFSQRDSTYYYIAVFYIEATIQTGDSCSIYFDTWNAKNTSPNNNSYKRLDVVADGTTTYYEGSGSGWAVTTTPSGWGGYYGSTTYGGTAYRTYEFRVPLANLSAQGRFDAINETIGFGVRARDVQPSGGGQHSYYIYYPDYWVSTWTITTPLISQPNTWSNLRYREDFHTRDYALEVYDVAGSITIDGVLNESSWQNGGCANVYNAEDTILAKISYFKDSTYLYIGICVANWDSKNANDFSEVLFDTDYDQTTAPDAGDKKFGVTSANVTAYSEGNGIGWIATTLPTDWLAKSGFTDGNSTYEFRMTLSELDEGGKFGANGEVIGFQAYTYRYDADLNLRMAIYFPDGSQRYVSFIPTKDRPDLWGELIYQIPEGDIQIMIVAILIIIPMTIRIKRRRLNDGRGHN